MTILRKNVLGVECRYDCAINITELITLEDAMTEYGLGPNGGLLFCMEFLLKNLEWLFTRFDEHPSRDDRWSE